MRWAAFCCVGIELDAVADFVDYDFDGFVVFVEGKGGEGEAVCFDFFACRGG